MPHQTILAYLAFMTHGGMFLVEATVQETNLVIIHITKWVGSYPSTSLSRMALWLMSRSKQLYSIAAQTIHGQTPAPTQLIQSLHISFNTSLQSHASV